MEQSLVLIIDRNLRGLERAFDRNFLDEKILRMGLG